MTKTACLGGSSVGLAGFHLFFERLHGLFLPGDFHGQLDPAKQQVFHLAVHPIGHIGQVFDQQGLGGSRDLTVCAQQGDVFLCQCQLRVFEGQFQPRIFQVGIQRAGTRVCGFCGPSRTACTQRSPLAIGSSGKHHRIRRRTAVKTACQCPRTAGISGPPGDHCGIAKHIHLLQLLGK